MITRAVTSIDDAFILLKDVKSHGLVANQDFQWWYRASEVDDWLAPKEPSIVEFDFFDSKWNTFFELKWQTKTDF